MKKLSIGIASIISVGCLSGAVLCLNPATATADTANLTMVDGASVRLSSYKSGIGFTTRVNYAYYNTLDETYDVITGTLILPTDYLTKNEITSVTHENLGKFGEAGEFYQDVVNSGWKNSATASTDGYYEYRGSLVNLASANYSREFSAVGYLGYKTADETAYTYEYTTYSAENNSRAIDDVSFQAFVDRTSSEQTVNGVEYKYAVEKDETYSRYTGDERAILSGYMHDYAIEASQTAIMQDEDGTLELSALQAVATENGLTAKSIVGATRNEKSVELTDNGLDVSLNGVYNVSLKGEAKYTNGAIVPATLAATVDVWSQATKNVMISVDDIYVVGGYEGQSQSYGDYGRSTYTVGDRTGRYYRAASLGASVAFGKPLHSKEYYENWLVENPYSEAYISIDWYFDNPDCDPDGEVRTFDRFSGFSQYLVNEKFNTWFNGTKELSSFLADDFDGISSYYDVMKEEIATVSYGRFSDGNGVKDIDGNLVYDYILATKIEKKMDNLYLSAMTIELGEIKTIKTEELVDRNSETTIDPSLTEEELEVISYWKNQGYTISYEFVKRYSDGTPISTGTTVDSLATYTIDSTVEDGIYYLNATATNGENTGVCLSKWYDIYDSTAEVEYESFKHSDSEYAVVAYAAEFNSKICGGETSGTVELSWFEEELYYSYNVAFGTDTSTRTAVENEDGSTEYTDIAYSAIYNDQQLNYNSNTIYMLSMDKSNGYLSFDWSSWATHEKLDALEGKVSTEQGYVITQVIPRHSKLYYESHKDTYGDLSYKIRSAYGKQFYMSDISEGTLTLTYSRWYAASDRNISSNVVATIDSVIENYEAFSSGKVPMFIIKQVGLSTSSGAARLYGIGFESAN